jgi:hypothetical protein
VNTDNPETAASVNIGAISYRARCTEPGCANLRRLILRYADAGGRPMNNGEFCHAHSRARMASVERAGLKVYDNRQVRA